MAYSYYEKLCRENGILIPSYIMVVRNAERNTAERVRRRHRAKKQRVSA